MSDELNEELDTSGSSTETSGEEEPKVPISRLREEVDKRKKLETQLKTSGQEQKPTTDEGRQQEKAKLREMMDELETEKSEEEKKALEELDKKIGELKIIDPTLDEKALLDIIEKYGVDADKSFKIYNDLKAGQVPKITPKLPTATKTSDELKEEPFVPKPRGSLWEAAQKGLEKFGLK